jgi:hypothetical protein
MTLEQIEAIIAKNLTITDQRLMDGVIGAVMDVIAAARAEDNEGALLAKVRNAEAKFQAAHDRAEKQLANNRRIFHDR